MQSDHFQANLQVIVTEKWIYDECEKEEKAE